MKSFLININSETFAFLHINVISEQVEIYGKNTHDESA